MCLEDLNSDGESVFTAMLTHSCASSWEGLRVIDCSRTGDPSTHLHGIQPMKGYVPPPAPVFSRAMILKMP